MSWASRRRTSYLLGVLVFFAVVIGIPAAYFLYQPPTCFDGKQNQDETAPDKGGPCRLLDERTLTPSSVLWSRAFQARDGSYSAVAYIQNPNKSAGVRRVGYHFGLYDSQNVLIADRNGTTYIMPGGITPVFAGAISTGNRVVAHTYFEFTQPLVWERMMSNIGVLTIGNKQVSDTQSAPRLTARVENTSVASVIAPSFIAVIFDSAGNAFAASATTLTRVDPGQTQDLAFTWADPFTLSVGPIDILPILPPTPVQ